MHRLTSLSLAAFAVLVCASVASAQASFNLNFTGSASKTGGAGDPWSDSYSLTLTDSGGGTGAQGWSISLTADNAAVDSITTAGSIVDGLFDGGFNKTQVTTKAKAGSACDGKNGAVSAIVLSFVNPVTLPTGTTSTVGSVGVSGTIPPGGGTATLRFVDGCQGAGQPVDNNITENGATVKPALGTLDIRLAEKISCCGPNHALNVGFSDASTSSGAPYDGMKDDGAGDCSGGGGQIVTESDEGVEGSTHAFANISSEGAGDGVQGWSFSIAAVGDVDLDGVTTNGTAVQRLFDGGFNKTQVVDPAKNAGKRGAVSAVVLSFVNPVTLPPTGTESVLDLSVSATGPQGQADTGGSLMFMSGLVGAGQPVQNAITVGGSTQAACNFATASIGLVFTISKVPPAGNFIRGNANDDAKVNIADAIWIVNELFKSGPATGCQDAADANDDGSEDSADVTYLISYQFMAGPEPPAPFGGCGADPTADTLLCDKGSATSCP